MLVNLTDVFINEGQVQELDVPYEGDTFASPYGSFPVREKSPVALRLSKYRTIESTGSGKCKADVWACLRQVFARC